jgi:hypothetical protein
VNARVGGTASHTLHATTRDRETHRCTLRNEITVAIGMFRGPFEMDVGDRLEVTRRSRWIHVWAGPLHIPYMPHATTPTTVEPTKWLHSRKLVQPSPQSTRPQASRSMGLHGETQKSSKSIFGPSVAAARKSFRGGWHFSFTRW